MDAHLHQFQLDLPPNIVHPHQVPDYAGDFAPPQYPPALQELFDALHQALENEELNDEMDYDRMDGPEEWDPGVDMEEDLDLEAQLPWRNVDPMMYYRFSWDEIDYLIHHLRFPAVVRTETRLRMSAKEAFCLLTYRLSHPSHWIDIALLFC